MYMRCGTATTMQSVTNTSTSGLVTANRTMNDSDTDPLGYIDPSGSDTDPSMTLLPLTLSMTSADAVQVCDHTFMLLITSRIPVNLQCIHSIKPKLRYFDLMRNVDTTNPQQIEVMETLAYSRLP